ncbi:hypothetical protein [Streptomyces sp. NBRC 110611]|uniref:hypothetical protein n=1 Tax=Streptomyces sp. NBRC 110611 TaxID=1621259 RepID=UPI000A549173|nr:hypothetical protein [Streptomyces sp. NBRC 110611]
MPRPEAVRLGLQHHRRPGEGPGRGLGLLDDALAPEGRAAVAAAMEQAGERRSLMLAEQDEEREAAWRERALNAEGALKAAHTEILTQRTRIGELLSQIRELEAEWPQEAVQRITTENTTLKQRVRQLTADNRTLDERLKAARSNPRFQDRRVADLEARIAGP